jgi:hypothetical protein
MTIPTTTPGILARARTPILAKTAVTGSLLVALLGLGAGTAYAGQDQQIGTKGGLVRFQANGEILAATDTTADGYSVRAELYWAGGRAFIADFGFQDARERRVNLSIREGTDVKLRMCYIREARPVHCSRLQQGVA